MARDYLRDPDAIYRLSFETVRAEADLSRFSEAEAAVALRLVHACGMPDISEDLRFSEGVIETATDALLSGAPIICDCEMVGAGISLEPAGLDNSILCFLGATGLAKRAKAERTTRSAAQVPLWFDDLEGSVVVIGNAPTALFRLIEEIEAGAPMPAAVFGFPVGFVGAAESKQALADADPEIPHVTLLGRRGGSALAAAAVNAIARIAKGLGQ